MYIPPIDRIKEIHANKAKANGTAPAVLPVVDNAPDFSPYPKPDEVKNQDVPKVILEDIAPVAPAVPVVQAIQTPSTLVVKPFQMAEVKVEAKPVSDFDEHMTAYQEAATKLLHEMLAPISALIDDPDVTEIMINNARTIWYERNGIMYKFDGVLSDVELSTALKNIAGLNEKELSIAFDGKLKGIRVAAALSPVSVNGHSMCIRKHMRKGITLSDYTKRGLFDIVNKTTEQRVSEHPPYELAKAGGEKLQQFIEWMVTTKKSILVAGATGSGKTTLMRAILGAVPPHERLVTIEDTAELSLSHPNFVSFEANKEKNIGLSELVKLSLRYRPDRIIMGEVRGAEAYDLMDAFGTGHPGGCCSMHGESPLLALSRFENMLRRSPFTQNTPLHSLRQDICNAFKFVIFSSDAGGDRCPEEIIELTGVGEKGEYLYKQVFKKFV